MASTSSSLISSTLLISPSSKRTDQSSLTGSSSANSFVHSLIVPRSVDLRPIDGCQAFIESREPLISRISPLKNGLVIQPTSDYDALIARITCQALIFTNCVVPRLIAAKGDEVYTLEGFGGTENEGTYLKVGVVATSDVRTEALALEMVVKKKVVEFLLRKGTLAQAAGELTKTGAAGSIGDDGVEARREGVGGDATGELMGAGVIGGIRSGAGVAAGVGGGGG